jgi:hypothetical protein
MPMRSRTHRGSALIIALILVTVLSIVALALVSRTNNEIDAVSAKRHYDLTASCAEAARQLVLSKFAQAGVNLGTLGMQVTLGNLNLYTGHYSADGGGYMPDGGVVALVGNAGGASSGGATDVANKIQKLNFGTTPYRVTVVCQDASNVTRQTEVEFVINYGL